MTYAKVEQWAKAISDFSSVIELNSNLKEAYVQRGIVYSHLGQWDKAISDYDIALIIDPSYTSAFENREIAYKNLKKKK